MTDDQALSLQTSSDNVLITIDLKESWDWKTNFTESTINKTRVPSSGTIPPSLENGALFQGAADDSRIWMYGGTTSCKFACFIRPNRLYSLGSIFLLKANRVEHQRAYIRSTFARRVLSLELRYKPGSVGPV